MSTDKIDKIITDILENKISVKDAREEIDNLLDDLENTKIKNMIKKDLDDRKKE